MAYIEPSELGLGPRARQPQRPSASRYIVSTGGYKRTVLAKNADRAVIVFFLKEQPQVVGFAISVREKKTHGREGTRYADTPGIIAKHFPGLSCVEGRTKNSFRVVGRAALPKQEQR